MTYTQGEIKTLIGGVVGEDPAGIAGFVIVVTRHDGEQVVSHNAVSTTSLAAALSEALARILMAASVEEREG